MSAIGCPHNAGLAERATCVWAQRRAVPSRSLVSSGANFGRVPPSRALSPRPRLPGGFPLPTFPRRSLCSLSRCSTRLCRRSHSLSSRDGARANSESRRSRAGVAGWRPSLSTSTRRFTSDVPRSQRAVIGSGAGQPQHQDDHGSDIGRPLWRTTSKRMTAAATAALRDSTFGWIGIAMRPWASERAFSPAP